MPQPTKGPRLGGSPAHQQLILANLAKSLFEHHRITTTETKAKRLRPFAERLITKAKRGDLHSRRQIISALRSGGDHTNDIVYHLISEIGPLYANRDGGYTRITKIGPRRGDNAPMAVIELVEGLTAAQEATAEAEAATRRAVKESAEAEVVDGEEVEDESAEVTSQHEEDEADEDEVDEEPQDAVEEDEDSDDE